MIDSRDSNSHSLDLESLDQLLERLNAGDELAVKRLFVAYEPFMRMVIHRHISGAVRAKFDSADVVQSVWVDFVDGLQKAKWTFDNVDQFRAFLVKMTRNRFIDRLRKHREAVRREVALPFESADVLPVDRAPRVSENFYADELWQQMNQACPPAHRELLAMKRQGASIAEIAERTNLHESSVRRILYEIARRVTRMRKHAASSSE
jgi:RNA polymerase sigma-70 factor (ECF subfamily)